MKRADAMARVSAWRPSSGALVRWLEELPPFWTVFALIVTETVGATVLALPIAVAGVGPIPGLVAIVVLGALNIASLAALAEAYMRDGATSEGHGFFGRLIALYLGATASVAVRILVFILTVLLISLYYIGVATTIGKELHVATTVVAAVLFAVGVLLISRRTLNATISTALVVGTANIMLLLAMSALAARHLHYRNLGFSDTPFYGGHHFSIHILGVLFGVILSGYFGHLALDTCAPTVLRRDPSGRSLIRGCIAAGVTVTVLYVIWIVAVNGSISRHSLLGDHSTVLVPLAFKFGRPIEVLGLVFVVLSMGMASVLTNLTLHDLTREWLLFRPRLAPLVRNSRVHFLLALVPLFLVFAITEWFLFINVYSFGALVAYIGIAVVAVVAGALPAFLLVSARRKGDRVPGYTVGPLGRPVVLAILYVLSIAIVLVHAIFIWTNGVERISALLITAITIVLSVSVVRHGLLDVRSVVEIMVSPQRTSITVLDGGRLMPSEITVVDVNGVATTEHTARVEIVGGMAQGFCCRLEPSNARQLRIWLREAGSIRTMITIGVGPDEQVFPLSHNGEVIVPLPLQNPVVRARFQHERVPV